MKRGLYSEHKAVQKTYYVRTCALQEGCIVKKSVYDHTCAVYEGCIANIMQTISVYDHVSALYEDYIVNIMRPRKVFTTMRVYCMRTLN